MEKTKKIHINDMEPLFMIARYPRATIRFCLMFKPLLYFFIIGIVGVFSSQLIGFVQTTYQFAFTLGDVVASSMMMSVIVFTLSTLLMAWIVNIVGKGFGGKGNFKQMFRALCLTNIPYIWILPVLLFWMQLSPESYFEMPGFELTIGDHIMMFIGPLLIILASAWVIFLILKAVQEVHRFSFWKAVFTNAVMLVAFVTIMILLSATGIRFY